MTYKLPGYLTSKDVCVRLVQGDSQILWFKIDDTTIFFVDILPENYPDIALGFMRLSEALIRLKDMITNEGWQIFKIDKDFQKMLKGYSGGTKN